MFGITSKDADNLGAGLKICKKLRILKIYNSKMDDDKFYSVFDGIKNFVSNWAKTRIQGQHAVLKLQLLGTCGVPTEFISE